MLNVRRSDGRLLNWLLERQGPKPADYCSDPECPQWAGGDIQERNGIRWCDAFFEHAHAETSGTKAG